MTFLGFIVAQCLGALSQAAILFYIACGLTLIFGIMRIGKFAHGAIFMLGAYYFQDLALAFMYFLMLIVLVVRPGGLLGKED